MARSPANKHAMNGCEPKLLRMLYLANFSSTDWTLGAPSPSTWWSALLSSLTTAFCHSPSTGTCTSGRGINVSRAARQGSHRNHALGGSTRARRMAAHRQLSKANMGEVKAKAASSASPCAAAVVSLSARSSLGTSWLCTRSQSSTIAL